MGDAKSGRNLVDRRTFIKGVVGGVVLASSISRVVSAATTPIKIGCLVPLSGPSIGYGLPTKEALIYTCDKINSEGGILNRKLVPIFRDEQFQPEVAVRAAKDLIENEGCKFICGLVSSGNGLAISMAVKDMKGKALLTLLCATASPITEEKFHRYVSRAAHNMTAWVRSAAAYAAKLWGGTSKNIYTLEPNYVYGRNCAEEFVAYWKKNVPQAKVVGEAWPPLGTTDFTSYITAILATKPDIVSTGLYGGDAVAFMTQASSYGLLKKVKLVGHGMGVMPFLNNLRKGQAVAESSIGVIGVTPYPFYLFDNPESVKFHKAVFEKSGWYPDVMAVSANYYPYLLKAAMEKAETTDDLEKITNVFDQGLTINHFLGRLHLRGCDHQTLVPFWVGQIGWDSKGRYPMPILEKEVLKIDKFEELYHTCEEIKALRAKEAK